MKEWQKTLVGTACIVVVIVGGFTAYIGNQRANAMPESWKSALQKCEDSLHDKDMSHVREVCLEQGFITPEQSRRALR